MLHRRQLPLLHREHVVPGEDAVALHPHLLHPAEVFPGDIGGRHDPAHQKFRRLPQTRRQVLQLQLGELVEEGQLPPQAFLKDGAPAHRLPPDADVLALQHRLPQIAGPAVTGLEEGGFKSGAGGGEIAAVPPHPGGEHLAAGGHHRVLQQPAEHHKARQPPVHLLYVHVAFLPISGLQRRTAPSSALVTIRA